MKIINILTGLRRTVKASRNTTLLLQDNHIAEAIILLTEIRGHAKDRIMIAESLSDISQQALAEASPLIRRYEDRVDRIDRSILILGQLRHDVREKNISSERAREILSIQLRTALGSVDDDATHTPIQASIAPSPLLRETEKMFSATDLKAQGLALTTVALCCIFAYAIAATLRSCDCTIQ